MSSVGQEQAETMGRPGQAGLWIKSRYWTPIGLNCLRTTEKTTSKQTAEVLETLFRTSIIVQVEVIQPALSILALSSRDSALAGGRIEVTDFIGDVRDKEVVQKACQGVTCVIHTASVIDIWGYISNEELEAINVKGTQLLIETSIQQNVKCFIYTSSVEVVGPNARGDSICNGDEGTVYLGKLEFQYSRTKLAAEQLVLTSNGCLLPNGEQMVTCALRPMYIYGENSRFMVGHLDEGIINGNVLKRSSRKQALVNPVYVGNVAWAHISVARAMKDKGRKKVVGGKFYYITDDTPHMSYSDFNYEMMGPLGFTIPGKLQMPLLLMYFTTFMMEMLQFLLRPFIRYVPKTNRHLITMLNTKFTFTSHKAFNDFDYIPRYSWDVAKKRTTAWLASIVQHRRDILNKK
ncbi:hydroxy-delta-5-steroid dehydrogenase, 3 beta- and steroid delta-isomerase 1 isoform X2 [Stegostoma tigrinum]|uniref:hydroxy-delta-5-steroid dehydrogenase, 3 beta- and steroid delta-isomerase 1 isoform X2 n=1 Tax=Stegostoma tigrinum TaxID=3053191 RepID=UPI00202B6037|nr:hydroxy-delta-5-steroid dehydrogenase, 3 beta- and steroid delta-isomerase 1 isoform X2 [Stegostoma tigrinum]